MRITKNKARKARLLEQGLFAFLIVSLGMAGFAFEYYRTVVPTTSLVLAILAYQCVCFLTYILALKALHRTAP